MQARLVITFGWSKVCETLWNGEDNDKDDEEDDDERGYEEYIRLARDRTPSFDTVIWNKVKRYIIVLREGGGEKKRGETYKAV